MTQVKPHWEFEATLIRVIDGDTAVFRVEKKFTMEVDFGFYVKDTVTLSKSTELTFRFAGINCPESHGETKEAGLRASEETLKLLSSGSLRLVSYKPDKYGRWLADVYVKPDRKPEVWVNQALVEGGFAVPYGG